MAGIKTPQDFEGDIYKGVQDFLNIEPVLRSYLGLTPCHVSVLKNNVECDLSPDRFDNFIKWLNDRMQENDVQFENDFTIILQVDDGSHDFNLSKLIAKYLE